MMFSYLGFELLLFELTRP